MSHLSAGRGYPVGGFGRGIWCQELSWAEWAARKVQEHLKGLGRRQSPLLLTRPIKPVFKRLLKLSFSFTGEGFRQTWLSACVSQNSHLNLCNRLRLFQVTRQSGRVSLKLRVSRAEWRTQRPGYLGRVLWELWEKKGSRIVFLSPENIII